VKEIKKEIMISAPLATVWKHITEPRKILGWLMPNNFEPKVGRQFSMECKEQGTISCVVKECAPRQKLVYSFHSEVTKVETLVTITLTREGKDTRLTLIHSGWDALPPDQQDIADLFGGGWGGFLNHLYEQFWEPETN
jgi:uncharacterized protein YndB with AHSA1/START domain